MPRFQLNDEFYNIPDDISTQFLQDNPDAIEITSAESGKIDPPEEIDQGVPAEVNATPEIQPTVTELPSEDISLALPEQPKTGTVEDTTIELEKISEEEYSAVRKEFEKASALNVDFENKKATQEKLNRFKKGQFKLSEKQDYDNFKINNTIEPVQLNFEEVNQKISNNQRDFMENIPYNQRVQLLNKETSIKDSLQKSNNELFSKINDNINSLKNIKSFFEENKKMGIEISKQDYNNKIAEYNDILKSTTEMESNFLKNTSVLNRKNEFIDSFKRSYNNIDQLSNVLASTATDLVLGPLVTLDMLKSEAGKDKSYTKDLLEYREELKKEAEKTLPKTIPVESISNLNDLVNWGADAFVNFVPSGIAAFSGAAAPSLFFAMGYGGRMSEFELEKKEAERQLPKLQKLYDKTEDDFEKINIKKQIDEYTKVLSTTDLKKVGVSAIYGAAEKYTEELTTLKLVKDLKSANTLFYKEGFKPAFKQAILDIPKGSTLEGGGEGLNTLIGNVADNVILGEDKNIFEGVTESAAQGALIGSGFKVAEAGSLAKAYVLDVITDKNNKSKIQKTLKDIEELSNTITNLDLDINVRAEAKKSVRNKIKELNLNQDFTATNFLNLSQSEQKAVFEAQRQSEKVNQRWNKIASSNLNEQSKDLIRKDLEKEYNDYQNQKKSLIEEGSTYKNLKIPEGLKSGDFNRGFKIHQINDKAVKRNNSLNKLANKVVNVYSNEIESIKDFVSSEETLFTLRDKNVINKKEAQEVVEIWENDADGGFAFNSSENVYTIVERAAARNPSTTLHEYFHALAKKKGFTEEQFNNIKEDYKVLLKTKLDNKELTQKQYNSIFDRLPLYDGTKAQAEELINLTADAVNLQVIKETDFNFLQKFASNIKSIIGSVIGKEESDNFNINSAEDAWSMVQTFSKDVLSTGSSRIIKPAEPEEEKEIDELDSIIKESRQQKASDEVQRIYEEQGTAGAMDIIDQFKPIVDKLVNKYRDVPGFEYELLKDEIETGKRGILDMVMEYTPKKAKGAPLAGYINTFLSRRAIEAANRILDTEFTVDVTEAKGVTDTATEEAIETQEQAEIADEIKSLRKEIGLPEGLITDVKNAVVKTFGTKLPNPQDPKFRFELQKRFRTELKKPMLQFVGKQADYESFLRDNFESVYSKMPQSLINRRFKEFAEPVLDKNGKQVREKTAEGNKIYVKKKINKAEWIKYFLGAEVGGSTKGARKTAIVEGIAEEIAFDATMEVLNDPDVIQKYQDIAGITGEILPENFKSLIAKQVDRAEGFKFSKSLANTAKTEYGLEQQELAGILNKTSLDKLSNKYPLISDAIIYEANPANIKFSLSPKEKAAAGKIINKLQSDILKNIESENVNFIDDLNFFILNKFNEEVEKDLNLDKILENVINATNSFIADETGKNLISKAVLDTDGKLTRNYFLKVKQATGIALKKEIAELGYESSKKLLENRLKNASKNDYSTVILNWFINESKAITTFNGLPNITKIQHIFNQVLKTLLKKYNIEGFNVDKNPLGRGKKLFLNNTPINRYKSTTDIKINFSEYTSRINDEAKKASQYILDLLVYYKDNNLINEGKAHIKLLANDQIGALRKIAKAGMYVENLSTKETTLEHQNPILEITLASNNFLDGKISQEQLEKEFDNAQVNLVTKRVDKALTTANLKSSGKNRMQHPLVIEAFKQDIADGIVYKNIKSVYKEGQIKLSKSLNKGFNQILEESTGVKWAERFSPAKARVMAKGKGKGAIFVPYSADDFVGLLYTTLSEGEKGNQQMDWYRENLLRPFSRGIQAYESEKQRAMREWSVLKQRAKKDVPGGLTKQNESGFTNEQSLRMYMWQKQGFDIPNIKKGEVNDAIKAVNKNEKFKSFADNLMALNSEGYPKPENNWVDGDITTDLIGYINKTKRSEFLSEWQENVNEIFSEKNITKLRGLYGERYVEALENILYRMKTGVNRKFGTSKQERAWMDWVNNSVGAIMFFNARSAVLQTLSTVNFINFSDNNPINAAIALANFGQYRKDFVNLFNSDFLKQRRSGLQTDISADEIAKATKGNERSPRALFNALLKIGFTPTQIADSFAIASGGATFYRNRINKYVKEGLTKQEAEQKAFTDFQEIAEETQQSSRPDRVSMEQAGSLGRVVLAFANTPMQYARLQKKAALDLYNGRGDWKTNISKIAYYGVIQNIIFSSLQSALFTLLFDDEEEPEKKEKYFRVANSSADTFLRGMGVYGAAASTVKNVILEIIDQAKSNRPDYTKAAIAATSISPPINSKLRKLISAGNTFKYKQSRKKVFNEGLSLENPAFLAAGKVISAGTNIPADRIVTKLDHIKTAMEPETELWQAIALSLGWGEWELGMIEKQTKKSKTPLRKNRKTIKRKTINRKTIKRKTATRKIAN